MHVTMTSLRRAKNQDWFARKGIPSDLRDAYAAAFGVRQEERFRRPAAMSPAEAKSSFADWLAEVEGRVARLRSVQTGTPLALSSRERRDLCGRWYAWFVARGETNEGGAAVWEAKKDELDWKTEVGSAVAEEEDEEGAPVSETRRRLVNAKLSELAEVPSFLAEANVGLTPADLGAFLDDLREDFNAALALLRRRALGDHRPDTHPARFPAQAKAGSKLAGLTAWQLFETWTREAKPKGSTVTRWRAVFLNMQERFGSKDAAQITADDAVEWKGSLVTEERSARTANVVWLGAARTVFGWAKKERKIAENPFDGLTFSRANAKAVLRPPEFTDEEWKTLLRAALESKPGRRKAGLAAAIRWLPWLCAYTGARSGEVAQLRGEDVRQHRDGFWTITITPEAGTVKTDKARTVPLHEHLVAMGFPTFAQERGPGPLFYDGSISRKTISEDVTKPVAPPAQLVRQRMSEWVRNVGVTDKGISPNHAWRHTFKRRAARAGLEPRIRDGMCGHSVRDVASHYETATVEDLAEAMQRFPRYDLGSA